MGTHTANLHKFRRTMGAACHAACCWRRRGLAGGGVGSGPAWHRSRHALQWFFVTLSCACDRQGMCCFPIAVHPPPCSYPLHRSIGGCVPEPSLGTHGACRCLLWPMHCWCFPIACHSPPCSDTSFPLCRSCVLISPAAPAAMTPHAWTHRAELCCFVAGGVFANCVFGGKVVRCVRCFTFALLLESAFCSFAAS